MDLRGLAPEDVYQLMGAGLNNKQIEAIEQYRKDSLAQASQQHQDLMKEKGIDNTLAQAKFDAEQGEQRVGEAKNVGGRMIAPVYNKQGQLVGTHDLGEAPEKGANKKLIRTPEGKVLWVNPGDTIPDNSTYVPQGDRGESLTDDLTIGSLKGIIETGADSKENEYSEAERDAHMQIVNARDKNDQYVKVPEVKKSMFGDSVVPKYVKLPKEPAQLKALPDTQVVGHDEELGSSITMAQVRETAKRTGQPVEMVFKYLGLIK